MALRIPILEMHDVTAAERARPVSIRRLLARRVPERLLPFFLSLKPVGVGVSVRRLVSHQLHKPLFRPALDLEHHRRPQRAQPVDREKTRYEDRRDTDRQEPVIAAATRRVKRHTESRKTV